METFFTSSIANMQHAANSLWAATVFWYWATAWCSALFFIGYFTANLLCSNRLVKAVLFCSCCGKVIVASATETHRTGNIKKVATGSLTTTNVRAFDLPTRCPRCSSGKELSAHNQIYGVFGAFLSLFGAYGLFGRFPLVGHALLGAALSLLTKINLDVYVAVFDVGFFLIAYAFSPTLRANVRAIGVFLHICRPRNYTGEVLLGGVIPLTFAVDFLVTCQRSSKACTLAEFKKAAELAALTVPERKTIAFFTVTDRLGLTAKGSGQEQNARIVTAESAAEIESELRGYATRSAGALEPETAFRVSGGSYHGQHQQV